MGALRLAALLLALALAGCVHFDRDPLAIYRIDPRAFTMPVTTFVVLPF